MRAKAAPQDRKKTGREPGRERPLLQVLLNRWNQNPSVTRLLAIGARRMGRAKGNRMIAAIRMFFRPYGAKNRGWGCFPGFRPPRRTPPMGYFLRSLRERRR